MTRRILQAVGPEACFRGQAVWAPDADRLIYRETGTLTLANHPPMRAERCYHWHSDLSVHFEDGRFFHKVPAAGGVADHWCAPDSYEVHYDFSRWPQFEVAWQVSGPHKSYRMLSFYTRA